MEDLKNYTIDQLYDLIRQAENMIKHKKEDKKELWNKVVDAIEEYRKVDDVYIVEQNELFYCKIDRKHAGQFILDD